MSALIVVAFSDEHRAAEVLVELRRREWDWVADLDYAVVVGWNPRGNLRVQLDVDPTTREGGVWARLWGSLPASATVESSPGRLRSNSRPATGVMPIVRKKSTSTE